MPIVAFYPEDIDPFESWFCKKITLELHLAELANLNKVRAAQLLTALKQSNAIEEIIFNHQLEGIEITFESLNINFVKAIFKAIASNPFIKSIYLRSCISNQEDKTAVEKRSQYIDMIRACFKDCLNSQLISVHSEHLGLSSIPHQLISENRQKEQDRQKLENWQMVELEKKAAMETVRLSAAGQSSSCRADLIASVERISVSTQTPSPEIGPAQRDLSPSLFNAFKNHIKGYKDYMTTTHLVSGVTLTAASILTYRRILKR